MNVAISFEMVVAIVALLGSAASLYLNVRKMVENERKDAERWTRLELSLESLVTQVKELVLEQKETAKIINEMSKMNTAQQEEIISLKKQQDKVWNYVDGFKAELERVRQDIMQLQYNIKSNNHLESTDTSTDAT